MSSRKRKAGEEEELVSLPSGDEESEEDQRAKSATLVELSTRHALRWRKAPGNAPPSPAPCARQLGIARKPCEKSRRDLHNRVPVLEIVARRIDRQRGMEGKHAAARVLVPRSSVSCAGRPHARTVLSKRVSYVSDEEDEDDYEDDEEQEEDDEAPADDKAPPAKKAKTAPAEEQEEPEEEAEGEGEEDNEEPEEEFDEEAGGAEDDDADDAEVVGNGTDNKLKAKDADAPEVAEEEKEAAVAGDGDEE